MRVSFELNRKTGGQRSETYRRSEREPDESDPLLHSQIDSDQSSREILW